MLYRPREGRQAGAGLEPITATPSPSCRAQQTASSHPSPNSILINCVHCATPSLSCLGPLWSLQTSTTVYKYNPTLHEQRSEAHCAFWRHLETAVMQLKIQLYHIVSTIKYANVIKRRRYINTVCLHNPFKVIIGFTGKNIL